MAVKMSVNLSNDVATTLKNMASRNGITITEQLRRSITIAVWAESVKASGGKILVEDRLGRVREVIFQW
jgi:hypothetical protein